MFVFRSKAKAASKKHAIAYAAAAMVFGLPVMGAALATSLALSTFPAETARTLLPFWAALFFGWLAGTLVVTWEPNFAALDSLKTDLSWKPLGRLGGTVAVALAVSAAVVCATGAHWRGKLDATKRSLAARGLPVTLAEFHEDLPDDRYAYPKLSKAIEKDFDTAFFNKAKHAGEDPTRWTQKRFDVEEPTVRHYAAYLDGQLAPLLKPRYARYMRTDWAQAARDPLHSPLPKIGNISAIARVARLYAASRAYRGDVDKAWRLIRLQLDLADLMATERTMLGKMMSVALGRVASSTALWTLANQPGAVLPADLTDRFAAAADRHLIVDGLRAELASQFDTIRAIGDGPARDLEDAVSVVPGSTVLGRTLDAAALAIGRRMGLFDMNMLGATRYLTLVIDADAPGGPPIEKAQDWVNGISSWPYLLLQISLPSSASYYVREKEARTWARLAVSASWLNAQRRKTGRYPAAAQAQDAFGLPLLYKSDGKTAELCSGGPNGDRKDTSGKSFCLSLP